MDALACVPVADEEIVYQDLAICKLALQCLGPPPTSAACEYRGLPCELWGLTGSGRNSLVRITLHLLHS